MKLWLYLEPYSFIFKNKEDAVIYNTINSSYIKCRYVNNSILNKVIDELENPDNGYCTVIDEKELNDEDFASWVKQICSSFSGNLVPQEKVKPFIMKPMCRIYNTVSRMDKDAYFSFGRIILTNLNEVSIYLPNDKEKLSLDNKHGQPYYKQFLHNYPFNESSLNIDDYKLLLIKLSAIRIGKINLLNVDNCSFYEELQEHISNCKIKKCLYIDSSISEDDFMKLNADEETEFVIYLSSSDCLDSIERDLLRLKEFPITWRYIVTCENDITSVLSLNEMFKTDISIVPYYTGHNLSFFEEFVFNDLNDILDEPISKRNIFRREILNENFFGKLTIIPSGDTFANINFQPIGNIKKETLSKLVFKEMTGSTAWFMTRDQGKCQDCINKLLCPSISNYEIATSIHTMCHVHKNVK